MNSLLLLLAGVAALLFVGEDDGEQARRVTIENLVTAEPAPTGYDFGLNELKDGDELLGHQLVISKEGVVSKVVVSIEERKLPDKAHKLTALKGYVNGTAQSLAGAGLKLVKKDLPDMEKVDINKRTKFGLAYQTADGDDLFVQLQILFTDVGYNIMVVGDNEDDFEKLSKWAETIEPLKKEPLKKEPLSREPLNKEPVKKDSLIKEPLNKDLLKKGGPEKPQ
ncbi:MAG TPA: hypothetical protein VHC22_00250 [Pirellulales bacterium]|nr:hypothetical protein [Pirellulales bacterium]